MKNINAILTFMLVATSTLVQSITPYYSIRSQGANAARHLVGLTDYLFKLDVVRPYGTITITPEYTRTFNPPHITNCLFGGNCIKISGSGVANRGKTDWLADYFYLPSDFESVVHFRPVIDNFLVDFGFYLGLDQWTPGLYFMAHAPVVQSRWDLGLCEKHIIRGVQPHPEGLFTPLEFNRGDMLKDFSAYLQGEQAGPLEQIFDPTGENKKFLIVMQQLKNAKISNCRLKKSRVADLRAALGWNFLRDDYHIGFNFQIAAPIGNRPKGKYLFEPIIGNGHHWEVGGNINAHYTMWNNHDETKKIGLYFDANITHLFRTTQKRTFDLKNNGPFSRYMLAEELGTPIESNLKGDGITPSAQFKNEFAPVANLTNINVAVSSALQADVVLMANFTGECFSFDIGYNLWARTCEKICPIGPNVFTSNTTWALKGDARVFGFASADDLVDPTLVEDEPVALSATQSNATINSGLNKTNLVNAEIDSPQLATAGGSDTALNNKTGVGAAQINTSIQPVFIQESDLAFCEGRTRGLSSKFFAHLSYTGRERHDWIPHIGLGGEIEIDHHKCMDTGCLTCNPSQWGLWIKMGFSFE
ncbi:MAG: hypothetical protein Q8Q25_02060 [bacterium]|nr:hypothetical protein [bacterium]